MSQTARYGFSPGPYRLLPGDELKVNLERCGVFLNKSPGLMADGESPDADKVRFGLGGVSSEFGISLLGTRYGGSSDKTIINVAECQRKDLTTVLVRMRPTAWDRWNGATWLTVPGAALTGLAADRIYSVVMQDKIIAANKVDKLQAWDGVDANPRADLSADSPIAYYIAPFGNRLVAARIKVGGAYDPYKVQWSADGLITDWTTATLGAGSVILEPEGKTGAPEFIKGLSALETALVIYRDRSIVLGTRTGIGSQPFRWATKVFGLGTDSPYSIANAGMTIGDIFLASDLNVYLFTGQERPIPIGDPIKEWLRKNVSLAVNAYGQIDRKYGEYYLLIPEASTMWIFNLKGFLVDGKLSWRRRNIIGDQNYKVLGYGQIVSSINPVVDSVLDIVDTVGIRVDEYGVLSSPASLLLGDDNGGVFYLNNTTFVAGQYITRELGSASQEQRVDKLFVDYMANSLSTLEVDFSQDGGVHWSVMATKTLNPTGFTSSFGFTIGRVLTTWMLRFRLLSGDMTIYGFNNGRYGAGRATVG